jgi:2-oxoglutarate ferredoxin oxidoreductase subunit alpha
MMKKRMKKLKKAAQEVIPPKVWGKKEAEIGIIGVGSTFGPIREAMGQLEKKGIHSKFLQLRTLWPFAYWEVKKFLEKSREVFVIENNFTGQLRNLIQCQAKPGIELRNINKYSGLAFRPKEISTPIQKAA